MIWLLFVLGAILSWGVYGPAMHKGQTLLKDPMKALLCVGGAYMLLGVLVPVISLASAGTLGNFSADGITWSSLGGALGAIGAICIIWAFKAGGSPIVVMPLVFGGAPLVSVIVSALMHPPKTAPNPLLYLGYVMAAAGGGLVLYFKPS